MTAILDALYKALYSKLTGGTALTALLAGTTSVYNKQPPDGAALPYVVYNNQGGGPENQNPSAMTNNVIFVRAWAASDAAARAIDAQCDALLSGKTLTVAGATNFWTAREQDLDTIENLPSGEKRYMAGGLYRIRCDQ
jgi:hypothetical protein